MLNTDGSILSLDDVVRATSRFTGREYLLNLVKSLSVYLDVDHVWITEYVSQKRKVHALAFYSKGSFKEGVEYLLAGTPCENVIQDKEDVLHVPDKVVECYPEDRELVNMGARSFLGLAIKDREGKVLGHLAVMDGNSMPEAPKYLTTVRVFADRAGVEIERMKYEEKLLYLNSKLDARVKRRTEALKSAHKELDDFLYRTSHDLKGPISRMKGLINLLGLKIKDEYVDKLSDEVNSIYTIISQLERVAYINNADLENEEIDFHLLITSMEERFRFQDTGVRFTYGIDTVGPYSANHGLLKIILENLMDNSVKFLMGKQENERFIELNIKKEGDFITIDLYDTGEGIDEKYYKRIFDMFFRASEKQGHGLGLYLVKQAVSRLKGTVSVESNPCKFTRVNVRLPLKNR